MINASQVYREFDVRRFGWFKWEPYFIIDVDGTPTSYGTHVFFISKEQAMRVSILMRTQYNDGLWSGHD